jgi:hypothetical protein
LSERVSEKLISDDVGGRARLYTRAARKGEPNIIQAIPRWEIRQSARPHKKSFLNDGLIRNKSRVFGTMRPVRGKEESLNLDSLISERRERGQRLERSLLHMTSECNYVQFKRVHRPISNG